MAEQLLDPPAPVESVEKEERSERREPAAPALIPGWRCLPNATVRAYGEEGFVDLIALKPTRGVALIALLDAGEEASPEEARAAFRAMLADEGFADAFPGELPVVALAEPRAAADRLGAAVERAFAELPRPSVAGDWEEWLAERLAPARPTAAAEPPRPRLVAPLRDETPAKPACEALLAPPRDEAPAKLAGEALLAPHRDETPARLAGDALLAPQPDEALPAAAESGGIAAPAEAQPLSQALLSHAWLDWGMSFGFAIGIVLAVLVGLALISHGGRF